MIRVEFFETREEYEERRADSFIDCMDLAEALVVMEKLLANHPGAVVAVGR